MPRMSRLEPLSQRPRSPIDSFRRHLDRSADAGSGPWPRAWARRCGPRGLLSRSRRRSLRLRRAAAGCRSLRERDRAELGDAARAAREPSAERGRNSGHDPAKARGSSRPARARRPLPEELRAIAKPRPSSIRVISSPSRLCEHIRIQQASAPVAEEAQSAKVRECRNAPTTGCPEATRRPGVSRRSRPRTSIERPSERAVTAARDRRTILAARSAAPVCDRWRGGLGRDVSARHGSAGCARRRCGVLRRVFAAARGVCGGGCRRPSRAEDRQFAGSGLGDDPANLAALFGRRSRAARHPAQSAVGAATDRAGRSGSGSVTEAYRSPAGVRSARVTQTTARRCRPRPGCRR